MTSTIRLSPGLLLSVCVLGLAVRSGEPVSANAPRLGGARNPAVQPQHPVLALQLPDVEPPAALPSNRRLEQLKKVDPLRAKLFADLLQVLEMRLTPARPMLDNGAQIELASGVDFTGPTLKSPGGAYWLSGKATDWSSITPTAPSIIQIRVPTEIGKVYAVDCRVREYDAIQNKFSEAAFDLTLGGVERPVTSDGGHVLGAIKATAATTTIVIEYRDALARPFHALAFWGCDIGKAT